MNEYEILENDMLNLLQILNDFISKESKDELKECINHNESGIAFEDICSIILLYKIPIKQDTYKKIVDLGKRMNFAETCWIQLKDLIER